MNTDDLHVVIRDGRGFILAGRRPSGEIDFPRFVNRRSGTMAVGEMAIDAAIRETGLTRDLISGVLHRSPEVVEVLCKAEFDSNATSSTKLSSVRFWQPGRLWEWRDNEKCSVVDPIISLLWGVSSKNGELPPLGELTDQEPVSSEVAFVDRSSKL